MKQTHSAIRELVGHAVSDTITGTFDRMEVAEEEIALAKSRANTAAERLRINGAFMALMPPPQFAGRAPEVYRAHCEELLARVARGGDIDLGTRAECLCALLDSSLKFPLNSTAGAAAEKLFVAVFGRSVNDSPPREPYPGAADEMIAELRQKVAVPNRGRR